MKVLKKILSAVIGEETEAKKKVRLEKERLIKNQIDVIANMKCPICNNTKFDEGYISCLGDRGIILEQGVIRVSHVSTYQNGYFEQYEDKIMVCYNCGYVLIFADFQKNERTFTR